MNGPFLFLAFAGLFIMAIIDNSRGPIYPELLQTFNVTSAQGAWIFTMGSLVSFLSAISVVWWLRKFKDIGATKITLFLAALSSALMGFSGKNPEGFAVFLFAIFLLGICLGVVSITVNLIVIKNTTVKNQRKVLSALHATYGLASLVSPMIISYFYNHEYNWSYYFYSISILCLLVLASTFKTKSKADNQMPQNRKTPVKLRFIVGGIIASYIAAEVLVSSRMVLFLVDNFNVPRSLAADHLSFFFLFLLTGRMLSATIGPSISSFKIMVTSLVASILICLLGFYFEPTIMPFIGLTMSMFYPSSISWVSTEFELFSEDILSKLMIFVGALLTILHMIFGIAVTYLGLEWAMNIVILFLLISLVGLIYTHYSNEFAKFSTQS